MFIYMFLMTPLLVSCYDELITNEVINHEISFSVGFSEKKTRVATTETFETTFEANDEIGIFIFKRKVGEEISRKNTAIYVDNRKMTYDGSHWNLESPIYHTDDGTILDIYAYYPYSESTTTEMLPYNASTGMCDLLIASTLSIEKGSGLVPLMFEHVLSLVQITINKTEKVADFDDKLNVYFNGIISGNYNLINKEFTPDPNEEKVISKMKLFGEANPNHRTYRAWVPAQRVEGGMIISIIQLTSDREILSSKDVADPIELLEGQVSRFHITVKQDIEKEIRYSLYEKYPRYGDPIGIVVSTWNKGINGKVMSIVNLESQWSTENIQTGASDEIDAISNNMKIQSITDWETKYPAFKVCSDYGEGWYLPSLHEAKVFFDTNRTTINRHLTGIEGSEPIEDNISYFTSTEYSTDKIYKVYPRDGATDPMGKYENGRIRAFYEF